MVELPANFTFNQSNLQDFIECPRRFYLRHVRRLLWPNQEMNSDSENERRLRLGQIFHRLAQQKVLGFPQEKLQLMLQNQPLEVQTWWENFQSWWEQVESNALSGQRYAETSLTCSLNRAQIVAKYDLLIIHPNGSLTIYDWKTVKHPLSAAKLARHVQSRLYPYVLARAAANLTHFPEIGPQQIRMVYWFTLEPFNPQQIQYNSQQYQADEEYLGHLIFEIIGRTAADFPLTNDEKICAHCIYRTFCDRRADLAEAESLDDDSDYPSMIFPEDWEQIGEIFY
ncbi:MAG: PD-(D/E)XK nuclease family protein [Anaerolineales bacterium]